MDDDDDDAPMSQKKKKKKKKKKTRRCKMRNNDLDFKRCGGGYSEIIKNTAKTKTKKKTKK